MKRLHSDGINEDVLVDLTDEEIEQQKIDTENFEALELAKEEAKKVKLNVLERLGISEEEAKVLFG